MVRYSVSHEMFRLHVNANNSGHRRESYTYDRVW